MQRSGTLQSFLCFSVPVTVPSHVSFAAAFSAKTKLSPLVDKLGHLLLHLFALQLLLQEDLEARHRGGPLGVLPVGLRREEGSSFKKTTKQQWTNKQTMAAFLRDLFVVWV